MFRKIILGSRGSELALWQANFTKTQLEKLGYTVEILIIKTKGDQIQHLSFDKIEGKGFFTKELEEALLDGTIDLAVHSHKDLPTTFPEGLTIAAVSYREDCSESILISPKALNLNEHLGLKKGAIVGTSSARRKSQLLNIRPDLIIKDLRGNVPTRINKLRDKMYDAIVLASAGLNRLNINLEDIHRNIVSPTTFIPAPAQGVLAFQIRESDEDMKRIILQINDASVAKSISVERKVLNRMDGGCLLPLGVYCLFEEDKFKVWASLFLPEENKFKRVYIENNSAEESVNKVLNALVKEQSKTVYISRDQKEAAIFSKQLAGTGIEIIAEAPIAFEAINVNHIPLTDWIFFSSKTAVHYFFSQEIPYSSISKFAAMGSTTAAALIELGINPSFVGNDKNTKTTSQDFMAVCKGTSVLFPGAKNGMRSIQQEIGDNAILQDVAVYQTIQKDISSNIDADIHVFTSPSTVKSFLNQCKLPIKKAVAIGETTASALREHGISEVHIAPFTTEQGLADIVLGL
jgi:hydroxymethylbilane synthase